MTAVVFCKDPLTPGKVDPHFQPAAAAVRDEGATVALIDHDELVAGNTARAVRRVPEGLGPAWYRGWMVTAGQYAALAEALSAKGCTLLTGPEAFRTAHELPGWYRTFAEVTPDSGWTPLALDGGEPDGLAGWLEILAGKVGGGPVIVKDYVKSLKHDWDTACYVPDAGDVDALRTVVGNFLRLRGEDLNGGLVWRAFEDFTPLAEGGGEARVWWLDGEPVAVTAHPDTPGHRPEPDLTGVRGPVSRLPARFVTTDLALRTDGVWRVIEVGDGQVSDWPAGEDIAPLARALVEARDSRTA